MKSKILTLSNNYLSPFEIQERINDYLSKKGSTLYNKILNSKLWKKQIKDIIRITSSKGEYITKNEFFQELKEIKKDVKEVKKILNNNKEKSIVQQTITKLEVQEDRLIAQLSDGRKLSIPIDWFAKWGVKGVNTDKLKNYEIWEGDEIYFPDIDEVLGIEKFTNGFDASCERSPSIFKEQNEIERIIEKKKELFLKEWNGRKAKVVALK